MFESLEKQWLKKEMKLYTTDAHVTSDALKSPIQRQRIDNALALIGKVGLVLDVGANDCHITNLIEQQGNHCVAIDFPNVLRKARKAVQRVGAEWNYLPFKDELFDCLFLGEVIEHVVDLDHFMAEIRRVLKPKGKLILTTPNVARARNRFEMLRGIHTMGFFQHLEPIRHVRYYTPFTLAETLRHYGFKPERIAGGESEGGGIDTSNMTEEEVAFLVRLIRKLTPEPKDIWLSSFIVMEAEKR